MASLTDLISECTARGWLLNNLFQLNNGSWQANLRTLTHHTGWGQGQTPELALNLAMDLIEEAIETTVEEPTHSIELAVDWQSALANLRPKSTITLKARLS